MRKKHVKNKQTLMSKKFFSMLFGGTLTMMVVSVLLMSDQIIAGLVIGSDAVAGITMVTAMASAITKIPARADVAMTGEITLRGRVLPIGGLKEKILAAKAVGIKTVLVPDKNRSDVEEISEEIKSGMDIRFMKDIREIFDITLTKKFKRGKNGNKKRGA